MIYSFRNVSAVLVVNLNKTDGRESGKVRAVEGRGSSTEMCGSFHQVEANLEGMNLAPSTKSNQMTVMKKCNYVTPTWNRNEWISLFTPWAAPGSLWLLRRDGTADSWGLHLHITERMQTITHQSPEPWTGGNITSTGTTSRRLVVVWLYFVDCLGFI